MCPDQIPEDVNLLRCTVKKSWSVTKHLILCTSYLIDGIAAAILAFFGITGIWNALSPIAERLWEAITGALFAVPWWCYVIVLGLAAIPVYSALWCMARNLTEEDWQSEKANDFALAVVVAFAFAVVVAFAFAVVVVVVAFAFAALAVYSDRRAFLFIGAYLHYRERIQQDILERARAYPNE